MPANIPVTPAEVQRLTIAYFGRPADPASLTSFPAVRPLISYEALAGIFAGTTEYATSVLVPSFNATDTTTLINIFYNRLFARNASAQEISGWRDALSAGLVNQGFLGITILNAGLNIPALAAIVNSKFDSAQLYTGILSNNSASNAAYSTVAAIANGVQYLSTVTTSTPATLAQAQAAVNALPSGGGTPGQTFTLTTAIETIPSSGVVPANSTITGVIAAIGSTFQTGDIINANGSSNLNVTIAETLPLGAVPLVTINTLGAATFQTLADQTVNALLWTDVATVASSNSSNVLTVTNGALPSTYALSKTLSGSADGLTVGLRAGQLAGTADTIKFSVSGVGTAASTAAGIAAVDSRLISATTGVEGISVATTGANLFSVTGSTAAATDSRTLTVTGNGVNTIDARGLTQANNFNLAGSTGTNTLRLDNVLTSSSTIVGGSGTDTLRVAPTGGNVIANLSVSAVETLRLGTGSTNGGLTFAAAPNFTTVRVDGDAAEIGTYTLATVGSFATLNFTGDGVTANAATPVQFNALTVTNSFTGSADTVAVNLGNQGAALTGAAGYTVNGTGVTADGVETYTVALANTIEASLSTVNFASSTLQNISIAGLGGFTTNITAENANASALATVNLSGLTSTGTGSTVNLVSNSVGTNTVVTASVGGTNVNVLGNEQVGDTLVFIGGAGNDRLVATDGPRNFRGAIVANLGAGTNNILTTGDAATSVSITANTADAVNTINVGTLGNVSYVGTGAASTNRITAAGSANAATITAAGSTVAATITGSDNADTITGGAAADTITGGLAADRLTGGAGADRFNYTAITQSNAATLDTITDFTLNTDSVQFNGVAVAASNVLTLADYSAAANFAAALNAAALANTVVNGVSSFLFGGNTFVYREAANAATYTDGDFVARLNGTIGVAATTLNTAYYNAIV